MKTICIDCRFWGVGDTGIGRYVQNLVENLPSSPDYKVVTITKHKFHPYSIWAQFEMLWLLLKIKPDLLHVPHDAPPLLWFGKTIITVHDLIKFKSTGFSTTTLPGWLYHLKKAGYQILFRWSLAKAVHIITPSNYWKNALLDEYHLPPSKVTVIYEGVDPIFFTTSHELRATNPYLVYTGNFYPHKNLPILISAANQIKINTLLIGKQSVFANRLPRSEFVQIKSGLTDDQVKEVYNHASCFVTPSLLEGFGLPGLEAMAAGLPVIAARASCLPEIYGDAALYFDPNSVTDLIAKIKSIMSDSSLRNQLIKLGLKQSKKYRWTKMAVQTWQIYLQALL